MTLSVPDGGAALTIGQSEGTFAVGLQNWLGKHAPLHATSDGKVLLAFGAATLPAGDLGQRTPETIVDRAALDAELAAGARARLGLLARATSSSASTASRRRSCCPTARCRAALCISGPAYRVRADDLAALAARVAAAAARVAALLDLAPPLLDPSPA